MSTSNVPDGISFSDLQAFAANAQTEEKAHTPNEIIDGYTTERFRKAVIKAGEAIHKEFSHPMTSKVLIMENLMALMQWHTDRGNCEFADGDTGSGTAWLRDAGKLQAAMQIVDAVVLPDDFITSIKE